jgi:hypothetical protein
MFLLHKVYKQSQSQSQSYLTTDGQSASLSWCQATIKACCQFFFLLEIFSCRWTSPAQSRSGLSPAGLKTIFYCLNSWDSPNLEGQVPVFISPRNKVAQIYPRALGSLSVASYDSQGYGGGILSRLHTGMYKQLEKECRHMTHRRKNGHMIELRLEKPKIPSLKESIGGNKQRPSTGQACCKVLGNSNYCYDLINRRGDCTWLREFHCLSIAKERQKG